MPIVSNSYTNIFGGNVVGVSPNSFEQLTLSTPNTILTWPIQFQDTEDVTAQIMGVTSPTAGWNLILPSATFVSVGTTLLIFNNGANSFDVMDNTEAVITAMPASSFYYFILTDNTTIGGTWVVTPFGQGTLAVTSVAATAPASGFTISGSPIVNSGTFVFSLNDDLAALEGLSTTGIAVRSASSTWVMRQLTSGNSNITITNPDGVAGNPLISLSLDITNLTSLHSSAVYTDLIINESAGGDISLLPSGSGNIKLRGITIDSSNNISGIVNFSSTSLTGGALTLSGTTLSSTSSITVAPTINNNFSLSTSGTGTIFLNSVNIDTTNSISGINALTGTSVRGGSLILSGITLNSTGAIFISPAINTSITLDPTGTGTISLKGITIDASNNVSGINNLSVSGAITSPQVMSATAYVTVAATVPTIVKSYNVSSITRVSAGVYRVNYTNAVVNGIGVPSPLWNPGGSPAFFFKTTISNVTSAYVEVTVMRVAGGTATPTDNSFMVMVA